MTDGSMGPLVLTSDCEGIAMPIDPTSSSFFTSRVRPEDKAATTKPTDYETFLRMLTTQLQNQDPMNPMESTDYAVQLATFAGVEQQTQTNELLTGLATQFGAMSMAQMAGWVGAEARASAPMLLTGTETKLELSPNPREGADRVVMVVKNADGDVVNRIDLPAKTTSYDWKPENISGEALPRGLYTFELENYRNGTQLENSPVEHYARITEVRGGREGMTLVLEGDIVVNVADVTALRE